MEEFFARLRRQAEIAKTSLEIKRKIIEQNRSRPLPLFARISERCKGEFGSYWYNHFNTIGIIGMHEALLNFMARALKQRKG